jgi:glucan 1,3-beta-glucosidase
MFFNNMLFIRLLLFLGLSALLQAAPTPQASTTASSSGFWMANIERQGTVAFGNSSSYQIFRNVKDFGAKGMYINPRYGFDMKC